MNRREFLASTTVLGGMAVLGAPPVPAWAQAAPRKGGTLIWGHSETTQTLDIHTAGAAASLWITSLAMWAAIPKSLGFLYYYYPSSIWIALPLAGALRHLARGRWHHWDKAYLALAAGLFVYFLPIVDALPLAGPRSFEHWMWLRSWP